MKLKTILTTLTAVMLITTLATAEIPQVINYQGNLTASDGTPLDGTFYLMFVIYDAATAGNEVWNSGIQEVIVTNGLFEVMLGASPMPAFPDNLFNTDTTRYLGIKVGPDPEISPRIRFTSVACAYQSLRSDSAGYSTTANLANTATVASSVVADAIGSAEIADGSITNSDINSSAAIATSKISGTAVNLSSDQQITGLKSFGNVVPADSFQVGIGQTYNTTLNRYGLLSQIENQYYGDVYGIYSRTKQTSGNYLGGAYGILGWATSTEGTNFGSYGAGGNDNFDYTGTSYGVYGTAYGSASTVGVYGNSDDNSTTKYAGLFSGNVKVTGYVTKASGSFQIDHPLDPENKYLYHSFVESPDMMNVYNGNIVTDLNGDAVVKLPDYFDALNKEFRYQLTVIGEFAQAIIAKKILGNQFRIKTDKPNVEVSWQVTGVRKDKWAEANRIQVEVDKSLEDKGLYIHPKLYGLGEEMAIDYKHKMAGRQYLTERSKH